MNMRRRGYPACCFHDNAAAIVGKTPLAQCRVAVTGITCLGLRALER